MDLPRPRFINCSSILLQQLVPSSPGLLSRKEPVDLPVPVKPVDMPKGHVVASLPG